VVKGLLSAEPAGRTGARGRRNLYGSPADLQRFRYTGRQVGFAAPPGRILRPLVRDPSPTPRRRVRADHRPEQDPACAGCPQLGVLRALRRAGIPADGRLSCEPGQGPALADAAGGQARLLVLAGPSEPDLSALPGWLAGFRRVVRVVPDALPELEEALRRALAGPGTTVLVAVAPCVLGAPRGAPLAVHPARCNRCGGCLGLGCPAIADDGGEGLVIDPGTCTGCGRCATLCRGRAIGPALSVVGR
jgi:Pyruvate/2-oxoacid:ferredoxin oxidoreductase delta subunit